MQLIPPGTVYQGFKGRYEMVGLLAKGGMGEVYTARAGGTEVIIKVPTTKTPSGDPVPPALYDAYVERLRVETQILKNFTASGSPFIVKYLDESSDPNNFFLVEEKIPGKTLAQSVPPMGMPEDQIIRMSMDILQALEFMHKHNTIYRDMKPGNVMVRNDGRCVIIDFGGSKQGQTQTAGSMINATGIHTPEWSCPHQKVAGRISAECDMYAFGKVVFYMGTGLKPQQIQDHLGRVKKRMGDITPSISPGLSDLVAKALDPDHNTTHTASKMIADMKLLSQAAQAQQPQRLQPQRLQPQRLQPQQPLGGLAAPPQPIQSHSQPIQSHHQQPQPIQSHHQQPQPIQSHHQQPQPIQSHSQPPQPRIVLQGFEYTIPDVSGGILIGKKHDELACQKSGNGCNAYGQGQNVFVGWDCPKGCACNSNPAHVIDRHHMRVWRDGNGSVRVVNNDQYRRSAINRHGRWVPMQYQRDEVLKDHDVVALLYNEKKGPHTEFTFYER